MAETKNAKVVVKQDDEKPIPVEIIAEAIIKLDAAAKKLLASGLRREAIVVLLNDSTKVGKPDIRAVLNGLDNLRKDYLTK